MMRNKTLTKTWDQIGEIRNQIKESVKAQMGWKADAVFYDRVYGRVTCTPAEQTAFKNAFTTILKSIVSIPDLFPVEDFKPETIE